MADSTISRTAAAGPGAAVVATAAATVDPVTINDFESLNKWKDCILLQEDDKRREKIPSRLIYQHNRSKAGSKGFPSVLEVGRTRGLSDHEISALFGWTTGDYRFVNPIARGLGLDDSNDDTVEEVQFTDYPLLPQDMSKLTFRLTKQDVMPYIDILKVALSKLSTQAEGTSTQQQKIWRGHKRPLPKDVGSRFVLKGFTSATLDRDNAVHFCIKTDGGNNNNINTQRTLICVVGSKTGVSISKFSARPEEMEILFPPDTAFEVVQQPQEPELLEKDQKAVQGATEKLQKEVPEATIQLLYVKEV